MPLRDKLRGRSPGDMRDEREQLGFVRQPAVRWLSPGLLVKSGVEVLVSGTFGKLADKREIQRDSQHEGLDYSGRGGELWVDYISDTGDGWEATYTIAWLLAQEGLDFDGEHLPRAEVLLLGGDQVYPSAEAITYEDRFIGPFAAARPKSSVPDKPELYALPGNHDWYDGLASFLRVFCSRGGRIGDWMTRQRRSYFALKMPQGWWIWAIDIQLDTYIDDVQLDYFRALDVKPGDKVVLMTAKPAWIKALPGRVEPASWRYLSFFEERVVRASEAHLAVVITGDLHHYARYEPGDTEAPTRITAGGGGAYLSATHTLPPELRLRSLDHDEPETVAYTRAEIYPREKDSRLLSNGILKLALLNPRFAGMLGVLYAALGIAVLGAIGSGDGRLFESATADHFSGFIAAGAGVATLLIVALLFGWFFGGTDIVPEPLERSGAVLRATKLARLAVSLLHTAAHLAIAALVLWAVINLVGDHSAAIWLAGLVALLAAGSALGATIFGIFLLAVHKMRGGKAAQNANTVFLGQSIPDYKNLVRMRFGADGGLTLYPLGVDRAGREWDHAPEQAPAPTFTPRGEAPVARAIDVPLRYDAAGRRAY